MMIYTLFDLQKFIVTHYTLCELKSLCLKFNIECLGQESGLETETGIPADLHANLRATLLKMDPFVSDSELRAVFVDSRITTWRDRLQQATTPVGRVDKCIEFLYNQANVQQENALVLLLRVLCDRTQPADARHKELAQLADEVEETLKRPIARTLIAQVCRQRQLKKLLGFLKQSRPVRFTDVNFSIESSAVEKLYIEFPAWQVTEVGKVEEAPAPGSPPYKGMAYYDVNDADLFFGRERLIARLVEHLREHRFLAVVIGASGSGKSSIVRAGLVPALQRGMPLEGDILPPEDSTSWPIHIITPTEHPLRALAESLHRNTESVTAINTCITDLSCDPCSLHFTVRRLLGKDDPTKPPMADRLLLIVDQFEELFTVCKDDRERQAFVDNLLTAVSPETDGSTTVVITLRADFYAHCAQFPALREALAKQQEYIGAMTPDELRYAIEEPARRNGWEFESGLVNLLLREIGNEPGRLPLLSHALLETWKLRRGKTMTFEGYVKSGGVYGAIAKTAESVFCNLTPAEQMVARNIFLRLVELQKGEKVQATRHRAILAELIPDVQDMPVIRSVLRKLADGRLITIDLSQEEQEKVTVEVVHEALIREWPRLQDWLVENREWLHVRRRLATASQEWERLNRDEGTLYGEVQLREARLHTESHPDELNILEREFLAASEAFVERERAKREAQHKQELAHARALAHAQRQKAEAETRRAAAEQQRAAEQMQAAQKLRRRATLLGIALLAMILFLATAVYAAVYASKQRERAEIEKANAEAQTEQTLIQKEQTLSRQLAAQTYNHLNDLDLALLLGLEAHRIAPDAPETKGGLLGALESSSHALAFLHGHTDWVRDVAFSPNGELIASASEDGSIRLWSVAERKPLGSPFMAHEAPVFSLAFSPGGERLVSGDDTGNIIVWEVSDKAGIWTLQAMYTLSGHTGRVWSLAFNKDGRLASGGEDRKVILWDRDYESSSILSGASQAIRSVAFSTDSHILAAGSEDGFVYFWDITTRKFIHQPLNGYTDATISSVAFSSDDQVLASGSWDGTVVVWDLETKQPRLTPMYHDRLGTVTSVAFSPDGRILASGSVDSTIILWDAVTGKQIGQPLTGHSSQVNKLSFSSDGQLLVSASSDHTVALWSVESRRRVFMGHKAPVNDVAFNPDGQILAVGSQDQNIALWNIATGQSYGLPFGSYISYSGSDDINSVAFNSDGSILASGGSAVTIWDVATRQLLKPPINYSGWVNKVTFSPDKSLLAYAGTDGRVWLWDTKKETSNAQFLQGQRPSISSVALSPNGETLALGTTANTIVLWDLTTYSERGEPLVGHKGYVNALNFSPDGSLLASGEQNGAIFLWDVKTRNYLGAFEGHTKSVNGVAFSPDGKTLASASSDKTVILWDVETHKQQVSPLTGHTDILVDVQFSPDGQTLASSSFDKTIILWDIPSILTFETQTTQPVSQTLTGHTEGVWRIAFSPDGDFLASAGSDEKIRLWDVKRCQPFGKPLEGHTGQVIAVKFSPDGTRLASSGRDKTIIVWDWENGELVNQPLQGHTGSVNGIAFVSDDQLVSGGGDGMAIVWDLAKNDSLFSVEQILERSVSHLRSVTNLAFSPNGEILASSSEDDTVILWDVENRQMIGEPLREHQNDVLGLAFSHDGKILATGGKDKDIILWDVESRQMIEKLPKAHKDWIRSLAFSPNGGILLSGSCGHWSKDTSACDQGDVIFWDVESRQLQGQPMMAHSTVIKDLAFAPNGEIFASGSWDGDVILWDPITRQPQKNSLAVHTADLFDVALSPDGQTIAAAGETRGIGLWDIETQQMQVLGIDTWWISSIDFSPDGKLLVSASNETITLWDIAAREVYSTSAMQHPFDVSDVVFRPGDDAALLASSGCAKKEMGECVQGEIRFWDTRSGEQDGEPMIGHKDTIWSLAFNPKDNNMLASGSLDYTILIWDIIERKPLHQPLKGHNLEVYSVVFSPDGTMLASAGRDAAIILWDVETGEPRCPFLTDHADTVSHLAFSPDGKTLASASADYTIKLWDVESCQPIGTLIEHTEWVASIVFSPDGKYLISGGDDGKIVLWDVDPASWRARACEIAHRNLSRDEWALYLPGEEEYHKTCDQWPLEP